MSSFQNTIHERDPPCMNCRVDHESRIKSLYNKMFIIDQSPQLLWIRVSKRWFFLCTAVSQK